jgi:hypothetical protein
VKGAKAKKSSPGQVSLPWDKQRVMESTEVHEVAEKFIQANCYILGARYWIGEMLMNSCKKGL